MCKYQIRHNNLSSANIKHSCVVFYVLFVFAAISCNENQPKVVNHASTASKPGIAIKLVSGPKVYGATCCKGFPSRRRAFNKK
jgi:hypothetical protein